MLKSKFNFSTDQFFQKAENEDYFEFEGIASTNDRDLDGETIEQNFDLSAIKSGKGYINCDHGVRYENKDQARIGIIDEAKIKPEGLWIKGKVWKNHPESTAYYNELKYKPGCVQLSVEGYTMKRDPRNQSRIGKAYLTGIALTRNPINTHTYAQLCKSLSGKETISEEFNLIKSQKVEVIRDENDFVTSFQIIQELDPSHKDFVEYYAELIEKGGPGSGRKKYGDGVKTTKLEPHTETEKQTTKEPKILPKDSKDRSIERIEEEKREKELARETARTPEQAREAIKQLKEQKLKMKKIRIKKSEIFDELVKRSNNPEFKNLLEQILEKALTSGGPAYSNILPGDMSGGQVMQTEELESDKEKKKKNENKQ